MRMIWKLKSEQRDLIPSRQLVRMYCKMLLHARVDSSVFVRVANEYHLCGFIVGPYQEELKIEAARNKHMVLEVADQWKQVCVCVYVYICVYVCICIYVYVRMCVY